MKLQQKLFTFYCKINKFQKTVIFGLPFYTNVDYLSKNRLFMPFFVLFEFISFIDSVQIQIL